ncbi:MAG: protein-L-isoaspartate O-methyltransferase [Robiginitomaculum sp.]|nr:MAG: protein-L-isoaspartate O-methyltransferase [Robiginitomaculum sp.]
MFDVEAARRAMVNSQIRVNDVTDPRLLAALSTLPRELFVPKAEASTAYGERDVPLGGGRYLIKPREFAKLVDALGIGPSDLVLNIGAGRGYSAAILGALAETVVALEPDESLRACAEKTLSLVHADNVAVIDGDLRAAAPDQGPFDVIFVDASVSSMPQTWLDQLAENGRLGVFERDGGAGHGVVYVRVNGSVGRRVVFDASIPYLPGFEPAKTFSFAQ